MEYELIRSGRKTISIEISGDLRIIVRAPMRMSEKKINEFVSAHRDWIEVHLAKQAQRREAHPMPTDKKEIEALRSMAKAYLPQRTEYFARIMGVVPNGIKITSAKGRFGSCSTNNSLCFSLYLMLFPEEAIDYVVVHELSHILYHDHSKDFWQTVERFMPDYRERKKLLK